MIYLFFYLSRISDLYRRYGFFILEMKNILIILCVLIPALSLAQSLVQRMLFF
jgi:hypothetical protein